MVKPPFKAEPPSRAVTLVPSPKATRGLDEKLTQDELNAFYEYGSDRARAIVLGAMVENRLEEVIRLLMRRDDETLVNELFRTSGPLGTFGTKIRLAYLLRIVARETYTDLLIVYKIRNTLAHDLSITSFSDQKITAWVKNMHLYKIVAGMPARLREQLKDNPSRRKRTTLAIAEDNLLSMSDTYRECVRYIMHMLCDYAESIRETERQLNADAAPSTSP